MIARSGPGRVTNAAQYPPYRMYRRRGQVRCYLAYADQEYQKHNQFLLILNDLRHIKPIAALAAAFITREPCHDH